MPPKKGRRKTNVLEQVSKEIKTAIVNAEDKYGSPTNLKVTELPTIKGRTQSGSTQSFVIVDPHTQCIPYFVCKKCAVVMGPITCHRKCFLKTCKGDDSKKIKKRYTRAVQRLSKIKKKKDTDDMQHDKDEGDKNPSIGDRVSVQFEEDKWYDGTIGKMNRKTFRVDFDDGEQKLIDIDAKQDESWKIISDKD